ncbi:enoyl-CoA hydratase/isomerase family protein [Gordonia zhaorongruii]|uniref:enoyl-CoA hydratase/isomerase family protein n=1 Tax=Gordonia zhaorongruii TaxID=2597659 RepID=UPI001051A735|nr:enoyl-CoA hydratase/isomerase family protein [Gordonia zhaorongruii]
MSNVNVTRDDDVIWIELDRPDRLNAYDIDMARTLISTFGDASDAYAVVLTGAGRGFCAGGALNQLDDPDPALLRELFTASLQLCDAIRTCPRPVIAAVNGAAAGGGNELVIACDFAIAARSASFGQTGPRVGSSPVLGATNVLPLQIGEKRAREMAMLCRRYSADQALDMGLVNEVVDDDQLVPRVREWIDEIKSLSPRYLEITKASSNLYWNNAQDSMRNGLGMLIQAIGSDDMVEGASAFLAGRAPDFPAPPRPRS